MKLGERERRTTRLDRRHRSGAGAAGRLRISTNISRVGLKNSTAARIPIHWEGQLEV